MNDNITQAELERRLHIFERWVIEKEPDTLCGMIAPETVSCSAEDMSLVMRVQPKPWERNASMHMHGGMVVSLLDSAIGYLDIGFLMCSTSTITLTTNYLRPCPIDRTLMIFAQIDKLGRNIVFNSAKMWADGEPDRLIATATGTYTTAGTPFRAKELD